MEGETQEEPTSLIAALSLRQVKELVEDIKQFVELDKHIGPSKASAAACLPWSTGCNAGAAACPPHPTSCVSPSIRKMVCASLSTGLGRPSARRCMERDRACSKWNCTAAEAAVQEGRGRVGHAGRQEGKPGAGLA
jgi:hypothetical protein